MSLGYFQMDRVWRTMQAVYATRKPSDEPEPQLLLTPSEVVELAKRLNGGITGDGRGEAAPKATMFHDAGAIAQCGNCGRYTLDRKALSDRQPICTCGEQHYWSGSFKPPTADSIWHGPAPSAPPQQEQAAPVPDRWMPIETAPKDGKPILVSNGKDCAAVYWWPMVWMGTTHNGMKNPTHWMPLPAAPKAQEPGA